jgi:hypothetical protein
MENEHVYRIENLDGDVVTIIDTDIVFIDFIKVLVKENDDDTEIDKPKKEKNTNLLEMIVQNTSKANELTLRNMTYGGGQLAAEGVSSVQMANYRTVSSPRINATNDINRGIKKEVNATIGSNFLNFSPRRS